MDLITQLGGKYHPGNNSLFQMKRKLEKLGVKVTHPFSDEFIFTQNDRSFTFDPTLWSRYEVEVSFYESIATSPLHIVCNESEDTKGYIGDSTSLQMLYAMIKKKPIILLYEPVLKENISRFAKEVLVRHNDQFIIWNILEDRDDNAILERLKLYSHKVVDYKLNEHEEILIRAKVRANFRRLLAAPHKV
jgi:hypothetical protein